MVPSNSQHARTKALSRAQKPWRICPALCRKQGKTPKAERGYFRTSACRDRRGRLCRGRSVEIPPPVNPPRERIFNVPGAVLALAVLLVAIHLILEYALSERQASEMLTLYAFSPARYTDAAPPWLPAWWGPQLWTFVTYAFFH